MSSPSFENIDRWFFEYVEGNLSPAQMEQFHDFIAQHPELEEELEEWEATKASPVTPNFTTNHLIKSTPLRTYLFYGAGAIGAIALFLFLSQGLYQPTSNYSMKGLDLSVIEKEEMDFNSSIISKTSKNTLLTATHNDVYQSNTIERNRAQSFAGDANSGNMFLTNHISQTNHKESQNKYTFNIATSQTQIASVHNSTQKNVIQSDNLPYVVAALTDNHFDNAIQTTTKTRKSSNISKTQQLKRRFTSTLRKVKKMADQPVALSNSRDPHFHVPNKMGYQANFGMAGTLLRDRVQLTSRNQWVGQNNQQLINNLSWDSYVYALRGGIGFDITYSDYNRNSLNNFEAALTYSPKFSVSKSISIEPALRFKTGTININESSPIIGNFTEVNRANLLSVFPDDEQPIGSQLIYRDLGAGVLVNTKWFYAGLNFDNIRRHYNNFYSNDINTNQRASMHFSGILGTDYAPVGKDIRYSTYLFYQNFGSLNELWTGVNVQWNFLEVGGGISTNLDLGSSIGVKLDQFSVHYNIDYLTSRMMDKQFLSHQISMRYLLKPNRYAAKFLNL